MRSPLAIMLACAGMILSACDTGTGPPAGKTAVKLGFVNNTCGPADGAETGIALADVPLECSGSAFPQISAYLHVPSVASLAVGSDTAYDNRDAWRCVSSSGDCTAYGSLRVRFTDSTATRMGGEYRIQKEGKTLEEGRFDLKKCLVRPMCG